MAEAENMNVVNAHRLIAAVVYKTGKEHGVDPFAEDSK